jgi:hypothetical protein
VKSHAKAELLDSVLNREPVTGLTHDFYRYPARFSPQFVRAAIKVFTQPGDIVLDPFMGGGTTLVEARVMGRRAIGVDISQLATFIARVKTTPLFDHDFSTIRRWAESSEDRFNLHNPAIRAGEWIETGYQRNFSSKNTWPIRKMLELGLAHVEELPDERQRRFIRCALLKSAQWAVDGRERVPRAKEFREQFLGYLGEMIQGAQEFSTIVRRSDRIYGLDGPLRTFCLNRSAVGLENDFDILSIPSPRLILTSPPYPGVHILYHRWNILGRKETPAPFWIANSLDGQGETFYTFGHRQHKNLSTYYEKALSAFTSLARLANRNTWLVQMLGFSDPLWQLPRYLDTMEQAGFAEVHFKDLATSLDGRIWRSVPNRRWYATYHQDNSSASSQEVVLFHRLA